MYSLPGWYCHDLHLSLMKRITLEMTIKGGEKAETEKA